mgnify:CR=1 FL=1
MIDLDDPRTQKLADVISNATCKKILSLLAEHELSESELARRLNVPLNTINYNMKKLVAAGIAEPVRSLWSAKGRAVKVYRVSRKSIVISPRTLTKGVLPAFLVTLIAAAGAWLWPTGSSEGALMASETATDIAMKSADVGVVVASSSSPAWLWLLLGAVIALVTLSVWNWFSR